MCQSSRTGPGLTPPPNPVPPTPQVLEAMVLDWVGVAINVADAGDVGALQVPTGGGVQRVVHECAWAGGRTAVRGRGRVGIVCIVSLSGGAI